MPYIKGFLIEGVDPGYGNRPGGPGINNQPAPAVARHR